MKIHTVYFKQKAVRKVFIFLQYSILHNDKIKAKNSELPTTGNGKLKINKKTKKTSKIIAHSIAMD